MNKKTAIVLGGTIPHCELIRQLKSRGYYTILVDYYDNPPAKEFADIHIKESSLDEEKVLAVAQKYNADLTISGCVDQANKTACYVLEKMGKYRPYSYQKASDITAKSYMKRTMMENGIPTAKYISIEKFFDSDIIENLESYGLHYPVIVKPTDSNSANGVKKTVNKQELAKYLTEALEISRTSRAIIEEFMTGREVSVLSFVDGKTIKLMSSAQDHKRAGDGDTGLNTGGMGNFSPSPFYTDEVDKFCREHIYQKTVDAMASEGREFKGVIFFGLMLTEDGPKVLEYNARFGDPEAQVVLPRLQTDIIDVFNACIDGTLGDLDLRFEDKAAVCVVLASEGYPVSYEKGKLIKGLENFKGKDGYYCFHAGTKATSEGIVTNGGRVLGITAKGDTLKEARRKAYEATEWVDFENKYMRHDIGKAIDETEE